MTNREKKRYRALHRALWKWKAKHPEADKEEWPGWRKESPIHELAALWHDCFACAYDEENQDENSFPCQYCPILAIAKHCPRQDSLYRRILCCSDPEEHAKLCLQMADAWPAVENN